MRKLNCATCGVAAPWPTDVGAIWAHDWTCPDGHENSTMAVMVVSMDGTMPHQRIETKALPDKAHGGQPEGGNPKWPR